MELEPSHAAAPRVLIFAEQRRVSGKPRAALNCPPRIQSDLSSEGWDSQDYIVSRIWFHRSDPRVICEMVPDDDDPSWLRVTLWSTVEPIYQHAEEAGGLRVHGALVERNGLGVILTAPGSTGKSTACRRLPEPWQVLSDDESLIVQDWARRYVAHPFPTWSDCAERPGEQTWDVQRHVPLAGIFFLERASTDHAWALGSGQAALLLHQSAASELGSRSWWALGSPDRAARKKRLFDNACAIAQAVPCHKLQLSREGRFWEEIERVLGAEGLSASAGNGAGRGRLA